MLSKALAWRCQCLIGLVMAWLLLISPALGAKFEAAKLKISGYGVLGDIELRRTLLLLQTGGQKRDFFDANFIEDTAVILFSRLNQDGYLRPVISVKLTRDDGRAMEYLWRGSLGNPLPRPLRARSVHFVIDRGVRYFYKNIQFEGLHAVPVKQGLSYFIQTGA